MTNKKFIIKTLKLIAEMIEELVEHLEIPESNLKLEIDINMNSQLATNQKAPYVVNHLDGSPLKVGNSIRLTSSDNNGASIAPDAVPLAGLGTGFVVGGAAVQTGLKITADELDATGNVVDTTAVVIDIVSPVVVPPPPSNLSLTLGVPVPAGPKVATSPNFTNPFGR
jgi:hypothetical protein